jgi:hypothetical protein
MLLHALAVQQRRGPHEVDRAVPLLTKATADDHAVRRGALEDVHVTRLVERAGAAGGLHAYQRLDHGVAGVGEARFAPDDDGPLVVEEAVVASHLDHKRSLLAVRQRAGEVVGAAEAGVGPTESEVRHALTLQQPALRAQARLLVSGHGHQQERGPCRGLTVLTGWAVVLVVEVLDGHAEAEHPAGPATRTARVPELASPAAPADGPCSTTRTVLVVVSTPTALPGSAGDGGRLSVPRWLCSGTAAGRADASASDCRSAEATASGTDGAGAVRADG